MATNKVVTVTVASTVTGDTLEGYNFYSDQEGATPLNGGTVVTPANAAAGQTYALTDGVVHSVTAKPVGVSNGEFSAVESAAVSVDLATSIIEMQDDFTGTVIDTAKWTATTPDTDGTITQNDQLILTYTGIVNERVNYLDSISFDTGLADVAVIQWTGSSFVDPQGYAIKMWDGTQAEEIAIISTSADRGLARLIIRRNDINVYDNEPGISLNNTLKVVKDGNDISFWYWNTSVWTQMGTTQTVSGHPASMTMSIQQLSDASSGAGNIDNVYITNSDYATATPS